MRRVPIQIGGPTGGHRSSRFNDELSQNVYLDEDKGRVGMHDFPGMKAFATDSGADRGWHVMDGILYKMNGRDLVSIDATGTVTAISTISTASGRASFADDGTNLYIVSGGRISKYDGSTVTAVTQTVVTYPQSITYLNKQFIISGRDGRFAVSDVGDGDTYNALNYADAEVSADDIVCVYSFNQVLYILGAKTTELWINTGIGNPPFGRQDSALVNVGIAGKHAVTSTDSYMYWLGDDRKVYKAVGSQSTTVQSPAISHLLDGLGVVSDCIASRALVEGQEFIIFAFPLANQTIAYSETLNYWVKLSSGVLGDRWYGNAVLNVFGKNLVADYRTGAVHELDINTFDDAGDARVIERVLPSFTGEMIGMPGKRVTVGNVRLDMEVGVGLATGQGSAPVIMYQYSENGGKTWKAEKEADIGASGEYYDSVNLWDFCTGYDVRVKFSCSDPVFISVFGGHIDMRSAGF